MGGSDCSHVVTLAQRRITEELGVVISDKQSEIGAVGFLLRGTSCEGEDFHSHFTEWVARQVNLDACSSEKHQRSSGGAKNK